jgi:hypothetical protein
LWVTITGSEEWLRITNGTYMVHNVSRKSPPFGGSFRSAALSFGSPLFVRPGRQLARPMLEGRRTSRCTAFSFRLGRRDVQRKRHEHPTGGKQSGVCLFGNIVVSPVAPLRTVGGDCLRECLRGSLRDGGAALGTRGAFALAFLMWRCTEIRGWAGCPSSGCAPN